MNNPIHLKKLRFPTYRIPLWIVVCRSISKAADYLEDNTDEKYSGEDASQSDALTVCHSGDGSRITIIVKPNSSPGIIAHEALHSMSFLYKCCGVRFSISNDEPHTYMLQWIVDSIHMQVKQYNKKHNKKKRIVDSLLKVFKESENEQDSLCK